MENGNCCKIKKYNDIPIISHQSEKPCIIFEEINAGKLYAQKNNCNIETQSLNIEKKNNNIKIYESEKPCMIFEEFSSGKQYSKIKTSITDYKSKDDSKNNKYKDIPIRIHDSAKPSLIFEETNCTFQEKII